MHYPLSSFASIPPQALTALAAESITDSDQLLAHATTPQQRVSLSRKTGISVDEITCWAGMSDLVRIKGIGPVTAERLVLSGIAGSVQQFTQKFIGNSNKQDNLTVRLASQQNVLNISGEIANSLNKYLINSNCNFSMSAQRIAEIAEEAVELRPRLVLPEPDTSPEFKLMIRETAKESFKRSWKSFFSFFAILIAATIVMIIGSAFWIYSRVFTSFSSSDSMDFLMFQVNWIFGKYMIKNLMIIAAICALSAIFMYSVFMLFSYLLDSKIRLLLFKQQIYQKTYTKIKSEIGEESRISKWVVSVFAILVVGMVSIFLYSINTDISTYTLFSNLSVQVSSIGIILAGLISAPRALYLITKLRKDKGLNKEGVQRYLVYLLCQFSLIPIVIVAFTGYVLPLSFGFHSLIYRNWLVPPLKSEVQEALQQLKSDTNMNSAVKRDTYIQRIEEKITPEKLDEFGSIVTSENDEVIELAIPIAKQMIVSLVYTAFILLFLLPYFILRGWGKGIFYIILLAVSFFLENRLQTTAPDWFSLYPNSFLAWVIIGFALLSSALFFDWLYNLVTEKRKFCPECNNELGENALFCSYCGLVQI
ncbi:MAG: DUF4332 domain-containing protein [Anaerolineae bacterium]|nr:DUF4332 domain-containing protein [Anaerolineae bacterium]